MLTQAAQALQTLVINYNNSDTIGSQPAAQMQTGGHSSKPPSPKRHNSAAPSPLLSGTVWIYASGQPGPKAPDIQAETAPRSLSVPGQ